MDELEMVESVGSLPMAQKKRRSEFGWKELSKKLKQKRCLPRFLKERMDVWEQMVQIMVDRQREVYGS